jgi:glycosyltransferase involved in cell wall biosynthesis
MSFDTALRGYTAKRVEEIEEADILVGIPCFNNEKTIAHVVQMVTHGLQDHFRDRRSVIIIADGGSTDDTREVAKEFEIKPWQEKIVSIYRGPGGKGSALRSIFEAAKRLHVKACAVVDSDLRSITSEWVRHLLEPVLERGYHFVAPVYSRYKYDGTITNNIVYNLTRSLYGKRIRQPIGGDFAFSRSLAEYYIEQDVWTTDVARYGIDVWMSTSAVTQDFRICQANLGVKVHDVKDPSAQLGPMFRQVVWTLFYLMELYEAHWKKIKGSTPIETLGSTEQTEPEPVPVDVEALVHRFKVGFKQFGVLWKNIFCQDCYRDIARSARSSPKHFTLPVETWARILYELAATFHHWTMNRHKLVDIMTPLYYARVASFVNRTLEMSSQEAEAVVEEQAQAFENKKDYLLEVWEKKKDESEEITNHLKMV